MQKINFFTGEFTVKERRHRENPLGGFCLVSSDHRGHVYAIGGFDLGLGQTSARVDRYDIAKNRWLPMPVLN